MLLDLMLPGISGMEVLREIRQQRPRPGGGGDHRLLVDRGRHRGDAARARSTTSRSRSRTRRCCSPCARALEQRRLPPRTARCGRSCASASASTASSASRKPMQQVFELIELAAPAQEQHPDPRRERHRQGAGGQGHPPPLAARRRAVRHRQLRLDASPTCWRATSSATSRAPSPAPSPTRRGCSSSPTAARSSSTRSATSRSTPSRSCCG